MCCRDDCAWAWHQSFESVMASIVNFSGEPYHGYRAGLPQPGMWHELLNTDAAVYGGGNVGNPGGCWPRPPVSGGVSGPGVRRASRDRPGAHLHDLGTAASWHQTVLPVWVGRVPHCAARASTRSMPRPCSSSSLGWRMRGTRPSESETSM